MHPTKDASVHQTPPGGRQQTTIPVHQRLGPDRDVRSTIDARRRTHGDVGEVARRSYHPRRGGCYDSGEDQSLSPGVNTRFWSTLEDDRWTRMREEGYSANKMSGRLNACAVGGDSIRESRRWQAKPIKKDESCNNKGL